MKAESTIKKTIKELESRESESYKLMKSLKDKPFNEKTAGFRYQYYELKAHLNALRWVLDQ